MPKFTIWERLHIVVIHDIEAASEQEAREMVYAREANAYDHFDNQIDSEIMTVIEAEPDVRRPGGYFADALMIQIFKNSWPCHGLPDNLERVDADFDFGGDLVNLYAQDHHGNVLDTAEFDGPALAALVEDIQRKGKTAWVPK